MVRFLVVLGDVVGFWWCAVVAFFGSVVAYCGGSFSFGKETSGDRC